MKYRVEIVNYYESPDFVTIGHYETAACALEAASSCVLANKFRVWRCVTLEGYACKPFIVAEYDHGGIEK